MTKIDDADLFRCRYYAAELACCQERLQNLELQQQNIRTTEALIQERRAVQHREAERYSSKLEGLADMLKDRYGVEHQDQVDWETGEIAHPEKETLAQATAGGGVATPGAASPAGEPDGARRATGPLVDQPD